MSSIHVPSEIPTRFLAKKTPIVAGVLFLIGLAAFVLTLMRDPAQAWRAYVVAWLYFLCISAGAVTVAVVTWIVKAKWNWSVRRVSLSFVAYLPIAFLLFLPMLTLGGDYFPWVGLMDSDPIVARKAAYLNLPFLTARGVVGLLLMIGMAVYFAMQALRPDMGLVKSSGAHEGDAGRTRWVERLTQKWRGQEAEETISYKRMTTMAPAYVMVYAVVMSFISYDWIMSLEPHWFSTLFGGWFFMGALWGGFAVTALTTVLLKRADPEFDRAAGMQQLWDLGKLCFAFTVFWTYLFWSQYIVIWYGKLPWEQSWVVERSGERWSMVSLAMILLCFVLPFATLIGKRPKMIPGWLAMAASIILVGQWVWQYVMVVPSIHHEGATLTIWEPLIALMFLGLFIGSVRWFLSTFPIIQVWQPMVDPESIEAEVGEDASAWKRHGHVMHG
ncbi:MAG: hypothetical protein R3E98_12555 [Gemmatimonadota bacterium]|nr:hypothetical protein [Gemmatimonadota bacterium]